MDKQDLINMLRNNVGECERLSKATGLMLRVVEDLGFSYESRVSYFVNLASTLLEMSSEALVSSCNLLAQTVPLKDGTVLKEWKFNEEDGI